jgi:hypothetical protein
LHHVGISAYLNLHYEGYWLRAQKGVAGGGLPTNSKVEDKTTLNNYQHCQIFSFTKYKSLDYFLCEKDSRQIATQHHLQTQNSREEF